MLFGLALYEEVSDLRTMVCWGPFFGFGTTTTRVSLNAHKAFWILSLSLGVTSSTFFRILHTL